MNSDGDLSDRDTAQEAQGYKVPISTEPHFCFNCGSELSKGAVYCSECGRPRAAAQAMPPSAGASSSGGAEPVKSTLPQPSAASGPYSRPSGVSATGDVKASGTSISAAKRSLDAADVVLLILGLLGTGWNLIVKLVLVALVIGGVVYFIQNVFSSPLNEHSSCQQYYQADSNTETKALHDMLVAHHDPNPDQDLPLTRMSLNLYCNVYGPSAPIDGIYNGGDGSPQPAQTFQLVAPPRALVFSPGTLSGVAA